MKVEAKAALSPSKRLARDIGQHPEKYRLSGRPSPEQSQPIADHIAAGQLAEAQELLLALNDTIGFSRNSMFQFGITLFRQGHFEEALGVFETLLRNRPNGISVRTHAAVCCLRLGQIDAALAHYLFCLKLDVDKPGLSNPRIAAALAQNIERPSAIEVMKFLDSKSNSSPQAHRICRNIRMVTEDVEYLRQNPSNESGFSQVEMRIISVKQWSSLHSSPYEVVLPVENIPICGKGQSTWNGQTSLVPTSEAYLARLDNVTIHGGSDLVTDREALVVSDTLAHPEFGRYVDLKSDPLAMAREDGTLIMNQSDKNDMSLNEGFLLAGSSTRHFGHWFAEFVPKLLCLAQRSDLLDLPVIVDDDMPQQHYDLLAALVPNPLVRIKRMSRVDVNHLWTAPTTTFRAYFLKAGHAVPTFQCGALSPRVLRFIRDKVLNHFGPSRGDSPKKVFLDRGNRTWRLLENEEELIHKLQVEGFESVQMGELSFAEQVQLMRGARHVIGPNGSSFNNLIYAEPDTSVVVLQSAAYDWSSGLGALLELGYSPVFFEDEPNAAQRGKHRSFRVDVERVMRHVRAELARDKADQ